LKNGNVVGIGCRRARAGLSPRLRTAAPILLSALMAVFLLAPLGCVNRGQHAPDGGGGGGGLGVGGQDAGHDMAEPRDLNGPDTASTACVLADAGADARSGADGADGAVCSAFMSFENCVTYTPELPGPSSQLAFTNYSAISAPTYCGGGALAIDANLVVSDADTLHFGELLLTIPGGPIDLGGKTLTVHVSATNTSSPLTTLYVIPLNSSYTYAPYVRVSPLRTTWTTASTSFEPGDIVRETIKLSIQLRGPVDYAGKIYIDEIELTNTPPSDGGTGDAAGDAGDVRPGDARDGAADGTGDTRDGPAGN